LNPSSAGFGVRSSIPISMSEERDECEFLSLFYLKAHRNPWLKRFARVPLTADGHLSFFLESRVVAGYAHERGARTVPSGPPRSGLNVQLPLLASCRAVEPAKNCPCRDRCFSVGLPIVQGWNHQIPADQG
jgi:hypothetical protein